MQMRYFFFNETFRYKNKFITTLLDCNFVTATRFLVGRCISMDKVQIIFHDVIALYLAHFLWISSGNDSNKNILVKTILNE